MTKLELFVKTDTDLLYNPSVCCLLKRFSAKRIKNGQGQFPTVRFVRRISHALFVQDLVTGLQRDENMVLSKNISIFYKERFYFFFLSRLFFISLWCEQVFHTRKNQPDLLSWTSSLKHHFCIALGHLHSIFFIHEVWQGILWRLLDRFQNESDACSKFDTCLLYLHLACGKLFNVPLHWESTVLVALQECIDQLHVDSK